MTFDQAERLYYQLEAQYRAGQLSEAQYQVEIGRLRVVDPQGDHWQVQEHTGRWHVYRQGHWQPAMPPGRMPPAPSAWSQQSGSPSTPSSTQQTIIQRAPSAPAQPPAQQPWGQDPPVRSTPSSTQQTIIQRTPSPSAQPPAQQSWGPHSTLPASAPSSSTPPWAHGPAPVASASGQAGKRRRRLPVFLAIGLVVVSVICAGALCIGYRFYVGSRGAGTSTGERAAIRPTPTPATDTRPRPDIGYEERGTIGAPAGSTTGDEHGAKLEVPSDALPDGEGALLIASAIKGKFADALEKNYTLDTPFYIVSAAGEHDGRARAKLSLPAPSPHSRLLAMVDGIYPAVLNTQPQDGVLNLEVRLGSAKGDEAGEAETTPPREAIRYAVITPKTTGWHSAARALSRGGTTEGKAGDELSYAAGPRQSEAMVRAPEEYLDCGVRASPGDIVPGWCRCNSEGTIFVTYPVWGEFTSDQADRAIAQLQDALGRFGGLGFKAVQLGFTQQMYITIQRSGEDLEYNAKTGVLYAPAKFFDTKSGSAPLYALYHEVAHWIEDEEYVMNVAMVSNAAHRWWLEIAADLMVMLIEPSYVEFLLDNHGDLPVAGAGEALSIQLSPYQWPGDLYGHAHQVMFNMCDDSSVCPLSQAQFVETINRGTYPFDAEGAQRKLTANLEEYARYLAGSPPERANTAMPQTGRTATGEGYGHEIACKANNAGEYRLLYDGPAPHLRLDKSSGTEIIHIDTALQKDGVYPLRVLGGKPGSNESLPVALFVEPGVPLWYRYGSDEAGFHDGKEGLVFQPIHTSMGLESARLVAFGRDGGETVRGEVRPIDLSGAMVVKAESEIANRIICTGDTGEDPVESDVAQLSAMLSSAAIAMGDFRPGDTPGAYKWQLVPARVTKDASSLSGNVEGSMAFEPDQLVLKATYRIPQPESGALPGSDALGLLGVLAGTVPLACLGSRGSSRRRAVAVVLLATALLLSSCLTDLEFYGEVRAEIRFRELEYVGGDAVPTMTVRGLSDEGTAPIWRLSDGTGSYVVDFTVAGTKEDDEGNQIEEKITCTGMADYDVTAEIYENLVVKADP